jgi:hypothetical protein
MKKFLASLVAAIAFAGCANVAVVPFTSVAQDFQDAADNFTAAGMPTEAQCMKDALAKLQSSSGQNFKVSGVVSGGSVAYIGANQVNDFLAQGPNALSQSCLAVVGKVQLAGMNKVLKLGGAGFGF